MASNCCVKNVVSSIPARLTIAFSCAKYRSSACCAVPGSLSSHVGAYSGYRCEQKFRLSIQEALHQGLSCTSLAVPLHVVPEPVTSVGAVAKAVLNVDWAVITPDLSILLTSANEVSAGQAGHFPSSERICDITERVGVPCNTPAVPVVVVF